MNATVLAEKTAQQTMNSLELSKVTGRRHDTLKVSIERMNKDLITMGKPSVTESEYTYGNNIKASMYILNMYQIELLALALDGKARIKALDLIYEMRNKVLEDEHAKLAEQRLTIATSDHEMIQDMGRFEMGQFIQKQGTKGLRRMMNYLINTHESLSETCDQQDREIRELKANNNKYKALTTNVATLGQAEVLMSVEEAGVEIGIPRNRLFMKLRNNKMLKIDNAPYKKYDGEYFVQKKVKFDKGGSKTQYMQTFVLPKGLEMLQERFA